MPNKSAALGNADEFLTARVRAWTGLGHPTSRVELLASYAGRWKPTSSCQAPKLWLFLTGPLYNDLHAVA